MKKLAIVVLVLAILTGGYFLYRAITQKPKTGQKSENTTAQNVAEKKVGDLALKNALLEDVKIEMGILSVLKIIRGDFSDKTPFHLTVISNKKTNDIQLNLDWTFQIQPRTLRMYPFSAKAKLKLAGSFRQVEPLIESLGVDLGKADKDGFYSLEMNESTLGGPPLPPQLPPSFNRPGPGQP